ncbi:MAG TPA: sugar ABC transporter ATP-binding protein [Tepidisphaeraceae bacterium]|nr:sugar ABC transporter ATP-binding protein [Tepidisphaeraceae bacterium]
MPRLVMKNVCKSFGATRALAGVDLSVSAGEVLALVGENGAGKSTLMKILSGAHHCDAGEIWLDDKPYRPRDPHDARLAGVAMIYQELAQCPHLTVAENILLGCERTRGPLIRRGESRRVAAEAMAQVGRPDISPNEPLGNLGLADRQLVEIARAVAVGCKVLVVDEPTSSLSIRDAQRLFELIRRLKTQGHAIIYISHFLEEVKALSDRFLVLRDGRSVGGGKTSEATESQIVALMVGRQVEELYFRSPRQAGDVVLEVKNLAAGNSRLSDASFQLRRGEVLGIAGLVGSGRTEMLRTIFGLDHLTAGQIRVHDRTGHATPGRRWRQRVGLLSEDRKAEGLALNLSIADNITMASLGPIVRPARQEQSSRAWIERLSIRCRTPRQPASDLSGGNQQKVAVARLLHHGVDVLLLDEPTRGVDVGSRAQIYKLIDELACSGKAIVMVSSYLPELLGVCDRIAVMCNGRLGRARPATQTSEHAIMLEATGGIMNAER